MNAGGITPCADYNDTADEVDSFIDSMLSWYRELLAERLDMYERAFDQLDVDIETARQNCEEAHDDQDLLISSQLDDIEAQIDAICNP